MNQEDVDLLILLLTDIRDALERMNGHLYKISTK